MLFRNRWENFSITKWILSYDLGKDALVIYYPMSIRFFFFMFSVNRFFSFKLLFLCLCLHKNKIYVKTNRYTYYTLLLESKIFSIYYLKFFEAAEFKSGLKIVEFFKKISYKKINKKTAENSEKMLKNTFTNVGKKNFLSKLIKSICLKKTLI